ncbi:MAG: glycogen/starch/alpha-glucan phosphorylase [Pigmentiphaga sp.]|uniref:glycogen/starch/alpha-glucan phosphorylase n=1 Tax=Pigmentiphaga sp. TaxID=1977564 RepID=UPI0029B76087|nr:glycogen/starch/alpha-glucan phosphorylase [Pigmentiphaga sp.]MDX3905647.1 glycogen/starch/alpha-glucan phosphorylase [Pigmentiphaga sp.]
MSALAPQSPLGDNDDDRTSLSKESLKRAFFDHLFYTIGKFPKISGKNDLYLALAHTIRDRSLHRWISSTAQYNQTAPRTVAYLSAEFLMGPHLGNHLINLGIADNVREALAEMKLDFNEVLRQEEEPGLGNGGLGRLAACFLDSLATQEIPAFGYGIRYEYGIFFQTIIDGWQVENTDKWLRYGNPWEIQRAEWAVEVKLGGRTEQYIDDSGCLRVRWVPEKTVVGVPFDSPIPGYRVNTTNTLRLWRAEATESFDFSVFNKGDYLGAVSKKVTSENLTKVLYPNDETEQGKELRLEQQYFFVSCSLQDMIRIHLVRGGAVTDFDKKFAIQLNDTHPAIAIAELMRLLVDEHLLPWEQAWGITTRTFSYTNHTLLPEALERWPLALFQRILPRHLELIYEINARFLNDVRIHFLGDESRISRLSLIDETGERYVRMAHLACVGSHAINGVAELHSDLLKTGLLKDFYEMWPEKFTNVTNGVTPRRWLVLSNPRLTSLVTRAIGDAWVTDLPRIREIEDYVDDSAFRKEWRAVKRANKADLAALILRRTGVQVDPDSMFDVLVKRIHEYKRQHLAVLHIVTLYHRLKSGRARDLQPRTFIFGGKAAPGYYMAKLMIKLITSVGEVINHDPDVHDLLKVVFLPNFNVTQGQCIYPAADLSEQISLAGKEASGTGNMKFAMNGALTIGTMDGANIELRDQVGAENFFLFGHTAEEVHKLRAAGYRPSDYYDSHSELRICLDLIQSGFFSRGDAALFRPLIDDLLQRDPYLLLADYQSYIECQDLVSEAYRDTERWTSMSILNAARSGKFSSDRSIREYSEQIWKVRPVPVELYDQAELERTLEAPGAPRPAAAVRE